MIRLPKLSFSGPLAVPPAIGLGSLAIFALVGEWGHRQITQSRRSEFADEPGRWGLPDPERVMLVSRDGVQLSAFFFARAEPAPTVIVCHGHGGNKLTILPVAQFLAPRFNVLLLDSRGHGESGGCRTTIGYEERIDVYAAIDEMERRRRGPIGILGMSMGGAIAILAAAEDSRVAAVVADSSFARLRWAVSGAARRRGYPPLVAQSMAYAACRMTSLRLRYPMAAFDPLEVVAKLSPRPLLLVHGEQDRLIDVRDSLLLYERASEPKDLWVMEGLPHCKGLELACAEYSQRVTQFFEEALGSAA